MEGQETERFSGLWADSLTQVEIAIDLEDAFSLKIFNEGAEKLLTIDQVCPYLGQRFKLERPVAMQPHQQRVVDEKIELDGRLEKLLAFGKTAMYSNLAFEDRSLLEQQGSLMLRLSKVLGKRIARFEPA